MLPNMDLVRGTDQGQVASYSILAITSGQV